MRPSSLQRKKLLRPGKPLRRVRSLEPGPGPKRKVRLRAVNPERRARKHARNFGDHAKFIRRQPCAISLLGPERRTPCWGLLDPAHTVSRGMGGANGTWRDLVPLCRGHHEEYDGGRSAFESRYGLNMRLLACGYVDADPHVAPEERFSAITRARLLSPGVTMPPAGHGLLEQWAALGKAVRG